MADYPYAHAPSVDLNAVRWPGRATMPLLPLTLWDEAIADYKRGQMDILDLLIEAKIAVRINHPYLSARVTS